ncbi:MAG TPA: uroporphyrinogen-III C-methyltransferase [Candidatus Limnocylindrales bacterium]|nr:uroporphyrinogen-III C-methyltransferase [Candidatus Limnocylindrales bacterium]
MSGRVYLVGAGPGDPGLLTLRGKEVLEQADVVLYDSLANARLLDHAPPSAQRILVGKRHGRTSVEQEEIEAMLVALARQGKNVVRLKGGDPYIFGRGGEEAQACRAAGIDFEIVPGVTSAIAVPAYAGIPLTHREHSSSVTFVTGQPGSTRPEFEPDWDFLARSGGTLVFLMAMTRIEHIAARLIAAGMDPATPVAAIRWGTLPRQQSVLATLKDIGSKAGEDLKRPPVIFVVGQVAALADELAWYERLPLFGRRVVVTRARAQAGALASLLERAGAWVIEYPTIELTELPIGRDVFDRLATYDWLVLTSTNGVASFFDQMKAARCDVRQLAGVRVAAIGPVTAAAIEAHGVLVAAQPAEFRAEALLHALGEVDGKRILLARAEVAREVLPEELRARGACVDVVPVYRTGLPSAPEPADSLGSFDVITFTSSSTVTNFDRLCEGRTREIIGDAAIAAIGPVTAQTIADLGMHVAVMPGDYTIDALAEAIIAHLGSGTRKA